MERRRRHRSERPAGLHEQPCLRHQRVSGRWWDLSFVGGLAYATEWSDGSVTELGLLPGTRSSVAYGINDAGQVVGTSILAVPESSTWAMMLLGFAGLVFAAYRRSERI